MNLHRAAILGEDLPSLLVKIAKVGFQINVRSFRLMQVAFTLVKI